jgi:hypothetical protein
MDRAEDTTRAHGGVPEGADAGFDRRTLVKGAAWSVPVIALAIAVPKAAASTDPWDVSLTSGCVLDGAGAAFLGPGFAVAADSATVPIPSVLPITETATGTWSMTLPAPENPITGPFDPTMLPGAELAFGAFSLAYATAIVTATLVPAAAANSGPNVGGDPWISPSNVGDFLSPPDFVRTYSGSGLGRMVTLNVTWDIARELTLDALEPGDTTYWGYFGALVPPDVTSIPGYALLASIVPGFSGIAGTISPQLSLTAIGNWTDADDPNHTIAVLTNLFAFAC